MHTDSCHYKPYISNETRSIMRMNRKKKTVYVKYQLDIKNFNWNKELCFVMRNEWMRCGDSDMKYATEEKRKVAFIV